MNPRPMPMRDVRAILRFVGFDYVKAAQLLYRMQGLWHEKVRTDQREYRHVV